MKIGPVNSEISTTKVGPLKRKRKEIQKKTLAEHIDCGAGTPLNNYNFEV